MKLFLSKSGLSKLFYAIFIFLLFFAFNSPVASAISDDQHKVLLEGVRYFNTDEGVDCGSEQTGNTAPATAPPSAGQTQNALTIMGIAKTENLGQQGALIGLMVGLAESGLKNEANSKIPVSLTFPHEGVGSDGYSVGVYQQQPQYSWSTIATGPGAINNPAVIQQLMTPAYAAEAFFGSPPGSKAPPALSKGLQNIKGWQSMDPAKAATTVQGNRDGSGTYRPQIAAAQGLLSQLWDAAPPIPLPVPLNISAGSSTSSESSGVVGSSENCSTQTNTQVSGDAKSLAQQILSNKNIQLTGRLVLQDVQAAANGQPGSAGVMTSSAILKLILAVGQSHSVTVSAIQSGGTGHCNNTPKAACPNDPHYTGDAVDFSALDGKALTGRDPGSIIIIQAAASILPSGSGIGQNNCGGHTPALPDGFITFPDSCNHLHIQVPKGTP